VSAFRFIAAERAHHPVSLLCRILGVSRSGFFAWLSRPACARRRADDLLGARIEAIHADSRGTYGGPRVHAELAFCGIRVGRKRVTRLMRERGLAGAHRRRHLATTVRDPRARPGPDLVERNFAAPAPDRLWVADITHLRTWGGWLYLAVVMDACSRRVVGWAMRADLRAALVVQALDMALARRRPAAGAVVHHSDQGAQYTSLALGRALAEAGVAASMGSVGDCYDNALVESFFATPRVRAAVAAAVRQPRAGADGRLRFHRVLLQPDPAPLGPWLPQPGRLRGGAAGQPHRPFGPADEVQPALSGSAGPRRKPPNDGRRGRLSTAKPCPRKRGTSTLCHLAAIRCANWPRRVVPDGGTAPDGFGRLAAQTGRRRARAGAPSAPSRRRGRQIRS
jgi:putative transposase